MGMKALMRLTGLPLSKSAPRAFCAFLMRSVSSVSAGIMRSAMLMMSANSWTGNLIHLRTAVIMIRTMTPRTARKTLPIGTREKITVTIKTAAQTPNAAKLFARKMQTI